MRPSLRFLDDSLIETIIAEARDILRTLGIKIENGEALGLLGDHGARIDRGTRMAFFSDDIIDKALASSHSGFKLFDVLGNEAVDLSGQQVNFTPGSSSLYIRDSHTGKSRRPKTDDYTAYARLVSRLPFIASQSTAFVPDDIDEQIADSYRLYLSLMVCEKPVVTGTFTESGFEVMKRLQVAVRGSDSALKSKPLTIFSCCPTSPLKWSNIIAQNLIDCARSGIPVEFIAMPLSGFISPVTLTGTLVHHTAETLSGIVISQCASPGAPMLYGGAPAAFDVRYETTPMGAVETEMIDCAYCEIGKYLNIPTQAYIALSDAKDLDAQAGIETSMGATLAALSGINNIAGPGMLDFVNCFSPEKLVLDNEICGMMYRMIKGIVPRDDFPAVPHFEELLRDQHLLISDHTRTYLREEHYFPGSIIDRANRSRWMEEGAKTLLERAAAEITRLNAEYEPSRLSDDIKNELTDIMLSAAHGAGMTKLPELG